MSALFLLALLIFLPEHPSSAVTSAPSSTIVSPLPFPSDAPALAEDASPGEDTDEAFHIPVVLNDSVEAYIEYFRGRGKDMFQRWLDNSAPLLPQMKEIFRSENLPEELVYVAMIESGFDPGAVSPANAAGPWQFMPYTARYYGLRSDWWVDERKEFIKSTRAAALLFRDLHDRLGSWPLTLAAYNAGMGKVRQAMLGTGSEDFWDLRASARLQRETKDFVPKFMAASLIARDPEAYGFRLPVASPLRFDEVVIRNSMDLGIAAFCADSTYDTIKTLNPELIGRTTPPHYPGYVLKIPAGKKKIFLMRSAAIRKVIAGMPGKESGYRSTLPRASSDGALLHGVGACSIFDAIVTFPERDFPADDVWSAARGVSPALTGKAGNTGRGKPVTFCVRTIPTSGMHYYLGKGAPSYFSSTTYRRR